MKTKHRGRIDANNTWQQIKGRWVNAFLNREVIDSFSLLEEVGAADEWCVEAYLNTDYSMIKQTDLLEAAKRYLLSNVMTRHEMRARK